MAEMNDTDMNYEAIGRCKVLRDKVKKLGLERFGIVGILSQQVGDIYGCDLDETRTITLNNPLRLIPLIEQLDRNEAELISVAVEYNKLCTEAGEKPIELVENRRAQDHSQSGELKEKLGQIEKLTELWRKWAPSQRVQPGEKAVAAQHETRGEA